MISSDRMAHQLSVARDLVEHARLRGSYSEQELQDLFVLGYLHDIGYEFATDPDDHEAIGGEVLKRLGFTYWAEVANHGNPESSYSSAELDLLNSADMTCTLHQQGNASHMLNVCKTLPIVMAKTHRAIRTHI